MQSFPCIKMVDAMKMKTSEEAPKEQKALIRWIKEHKKEIAIAGVSITALVGLVLEIKNKEAMEVFWNALNVPVFYPANTTDERVNFHSTM